MDLSASPPERPMTSEPGYRPTSPGERYSIAGVDGASRVHARPTKRGDGAATAAGPVRREQAAALIDRARKLLQDGGDGAAADHLAAALDTLNGRIAPHAEHAAIVQAELRHRFRNIVAVTQSLVSQTLRPGASIDQARDRLTDRLAAMGAALDRLLDTQWEPDSLDAVIRASMAHHVDHGERIHCDGPQVTIGANASMALTLALHELETNAMKYGALSMPEGRVDLA